MKKISIFLTLGLLFYTYATTLVAYENESNYELQFDDDDDFAIDTDLNNISLENSGNLILTRNFRSPESNAAQIAAFFALIDDPNALLNTPIYQQTSPVRNRPILEYPFTLTYGFDIRDQNSLSFMFFFNNCSLKNFTKDSTILSSYFDLANAARVATLTRADELIGRDVLANLSKSLALFDPATIQENRMGGVIESHVVHDNVSLAIQLPILYTERNLYLTPSQKAAVSASSLGGILATDGVDQNDFIYQHIVMDQFGLGDLKFKAMYAMHSSKNFDIDLGGFVILPTATALKQGIIGTWFDQNNERAYLDLTTIDPSNVTAQNYDDVANFFLASIDKLSSNILNCPLGNNGHVVIAPSVNFDWYFAQNWQFSNDFSVQIPLPAQEQRFYQSVQSEANFLSTYNELLGGLDPIQFVYFVNTELQNLFFPYVFPTMVYPGTVFNSTNQVVYKYHAWDFYIGSNFWYQGAESLTAFPNIQNDQVYSYDYTGASAASAAQEKLFAKINCNLDSTNYSWSLSAYGDITVWNSGIGNDYTLGLCVDCKF